MYRIMLKGRIYPFKSYLEALAFKDENGGQIYQMVYEQKR